jgi:hypothetical protein
MEKREKKKQESGIPCRVRWEKKEGKDGEEARKSLFFQLI